MAAPNTPLATAYAEITNTGDSVTGWLKNAKRYFGYPISLSCDQAKSAFLALNLSQKIAQTTDTAPANSPTQVWNLRVCGVAPPSGNDVLSNWQEEAEPTTAPPPTTGPSIGGMVNRTFAGVVDIMLPSFNPELMNLTFTVSNGRFYATELSTLQEDGTYEYYYQIDDAGFRKTLPATGWRLGYQKQFRRFRVPRGRTPNGNGTGGSGYRDNPTYNTLMIVNPR